MVKRMQSSEDGDMNSSPEPARVRGGKTRPSGKGKAREDGASPRGAKRARVNDAGVSAHRDDEDEDDGEVEPSEGADEEQAGDDDDEAPPSRVRVKTLPRDVDGYIPGSIVRINLRNFVTYDAVEFCPGPYLNMILGPNGTGKSSIACAICLGLNWSPAILGRANDLNEFVKINTQEGHIEIELKGPAGEPNLVIRRNITSRAKSSTFTLNGKAATGGEVSAKVAKLNVQVGNLCSFLPQDKVSSFAAMSPVELLRETENAAGDERLKSWHDTLNDAGKELKLVTTTVTEETTTMETMKTRNEGIQRDVQRYRERKKIEHEITLLRVLIPIQEYREARELYGTLKDKQRAQHAKVSKLKEKNAPAHAYLRKLEKQVEELYQDRDSSKKVLKQILDKSEKSTRKALQLESEHDDIQNKIDNLKKNEKSRVAQMKALEDRIQKLKAELEKDVKGDVEAVVMEEKNQAKAEFARSPYHSELDQVNRRTGALQQKRQANEHRKNQAYTRQRELASTDGQKLAAFEAWDKNSAMAVVWLRQNRDKFRMQVFEPAALSVTVRDARFASIVENALGSQALKTFVCQCQEDSDTLNKFINDDKVLGPRVRISVWYGSRQGTGPITPESVSPQPLNPDELKRFGFSGYASDFIECPEGMEFYLYSAVNLHRAPVTLQPLPPNSIQPIIDTLGQDGRARFYEGSTVHHISRSKYGRRALGTSSSTIGPARMFGRVQVNPADKQRVDEAIQRCLEEESHLDQEYNELKDERAKLSALQRDYKEKQDAFDVRLKKIADQLKQRLKTDREKKNAQQKLALLTSKGDSVKEGKELRGQLVKNATKRVDLVTEVIKISHEIVKEQTRATCIALEYYQTLAKKNALQELCDRKDAKYNEAMEVFRKVDADFLRIKKEAADLFKKTTELLQEMPDEVRDEYQEIADARDEWENQITQAKQRGQDPPEPGPGVDLRTVFDLQGELEKQQSLLQANTNTNPGLVEQYEKRKRDIESLERSIEQRQRQAAKIEKQIKNARDNWEPELRALVASIGKKFSAAFDRIGCAGEIKIREADAFDQWAIDILVKFRDTEKLQLLTAQRQSGGERALTTILYLMSLTEEARAPFSLVDEINQGMDHIAERMVHNSMVEVTCKEESAQYFLITPKLLPDLEYHERMRVLCVNNGEWLPEEAGLGNMMDMIDGYVAKNPGAEKGKRRR